MSCIILCKLQKVFPLQFPTDYVSISYIHGCLNKLVGGQSFPVAGSQLPAAAGEEGGRLAEEDSLAEGRTVEPLVSVPASGCRQGKEQQAGRCTEAGRQPQLVEL